MVDLDSVRNLSKIPILILLSKSVVLDVVTDILSKTV